MTGYGGSQNLPFHPRIYPPLHILTIRCDRPRIYPTYTAILNAYPGMACFGCATAVVEIGNRGGGECFLGGKGRFWKRRIHLWKRGYYLRGRGRFWECCIIQLCKREHILGRARFRESCMKLEKRGYTFWWGGIAWIPGALIIYYLSYYS